MSWNYQHEDHKPPLLPGDYRVEVVEVIDGTSKSSGYTTPMITIVVKPNGSDIKLRQYITEGEWFNRNMTAFFESFGIAEGDFDLLGWVGAQGAARIIQDPKNPRYLKIAYFLGPEEAQNLAPWRGPNPERHRIVDGNTFVEVPDDEESPF